MIECPPESRITLLLEGPDGPWEEFASRIEALGYETLRVESIEQAEEVLVHAESPIRCALLPAEFSALMDEVRSLSTALDLTI